MTVRTCTSLLPRLVFLVAPALLAQAGPMVPPPLMQFYREEIKPGHSGPHEGTEAAWARLLAKGKATDHYLGMSAMTGPSEAWFIMGYASYADWEAKQKELDANPALKNEIEQAALRDGEHLKNSHSFLGAYRKDLSFGPSVEIGKLRYFRIRTFRIRQGQGQAFEAGVKQALAAYEKSHYPGSFACYEVEAGMGSGTYVILRPMRTLADMDAMDTQSKAFREALGEEGQKNLQKVFADTVMHVENNLFALNPKLSFVGPQTIASDPAFWTLKPGK